MSGYPTESYWTVEVNSKQDFLKAYCTPKKPQLHRNDSCKRDAWNVLLEIPVENLSTRMCIAATRKISQRSFFTNFEICLNCWFIFPQCNVDSSLYYFSGSWRSQPVKAPVTCTSWSPFHSSIWHMFLMRHTSSLHHDQEWLYDSILQTNCELMKIKRDNLK